MPITPTSTSFLTWSQALVKVFTETDEKIYANPNIEYPKYILIANMPYFSAEYEKNHSPMGHYVSTYYKSTYQKDYNSSESNYRSISPGEQNPFYTTVTGRTPSPD